MQDSEKEISKYTLEAVFQAQESIRKHLDVLIKDNRVLRDIEERDGFFRELTYSTLGLGINKNISFNIPKEYYNNIGSGYNGIRSDVETVGRWLADQKEKMVKIPLYLYRADQDSYTAKVPIGLLWKVLKDNLFSVFPLAIDRACKMSKEREERSGESEFDIDNV